MVKKQKSSGSRKDKILEKITYKNCEIAIVEKVHAHEVQLDNKPISIARDADTGAYVSPECPYQTFGSLIELGKVIVDMRQEES